MSRFDVVYHSNHCTIQPHFCRCNDCFGTNEDHGYSFEEACGLVADWYQAQADDWRHMIHSEALYYKDS